MPNKHWTAHTLSDWHPLDGGVPLMPGDFFHGHGAAWKTWAKGLQEWFHNAIKISGHSLAAALWAIGHLGGDGGGGG